MFCNRKSLAKRKREEGEPTNKAGMRKNLFLEGCSTPKAASPSAASGASETETVDLSPEPQLPPKMRRKDGRSRRLRLTVAEALARVDRRRIILDPEEDSQLEVIQEEEDGPAAPPPSPESDSDVECTGMEGMQGSALSSIYGR